MKKSTYIIALIAGLLSLSWAQEEMELSGFRVPDYDKNGKLKSQLHGDNAKMLADGSIDITTLKIEFFDEGLLRATLTAPQCLYWRESKKAESKSDVKIVSDEIEITGNTFTWDGVQLRFTIYKNAKVILKNVKFNLGDVQ